MAADYRRRGLRHHPDGTDEKEKQVFEEGGFAALDLMAIELRYPG